MSFSRRSSALVERCARRCPHRCRRGGLTLIAFDPTGRVYPAYLEVGGHDEDGDCCYRRAEPTVADRYPRTPRD